MTFGHDWKFTFRRYLDSDVSGPAKYNERNPGDDIKIRMFSELCREDIDGNDYNDIITQLNLLPFNHFNNQSLDHNTFLRKLCGKSWTFSLFPQMAFLLIDNIVEAYECSRYFYGLQLPALRALLLNGRDKDIRNWDVKFLCAYLLVTQDITKSIEKIRDVPKTNVLWDPKKRIRFCDGSLMDDSIFQEYLSVCEKCNGKERQYLNSFRFYIFKIFNKCNIAETITILNSCHIFCYSRALSQSLTTKVKKGAIHPLTVVLQMMSDGYLRRVDDFNTILGKKPNGNFLRNITTLISRIETNDFPLSQNTMDTSTLFLGRYPSGTYVRRGKCLIINQTFKDSPEYRRYGTQEDVLALKQLWSRLGCHEITIKSDLKRNEIFECLRKFREELEISKPHFVTIAILSHGNKNDYTGLEEIMDVHMNGIPIRDIKKMFIDGKACPCMVGKPKLFLIQACRGSITQPQGHLRVGFDSFKKRLWDKRTMLTVAVLFGLVTWQNICLSECFTEMVSGHMYSSSGLYSDGNNEIECQSIKRGKSNKFPENSWFFVFNSTTEDHVSFRTKKGTFFIQTFCEEMRTNWCRHDLSTIATLVNRRIMEKYKIQASCFENQLGDLVYFKPSIYTNCIVNH